MEKAFRPRDARFTPREWNVEFVALLVAERGHRIARGPPRRDEAPQGREGQQREHGSGNAHRIQRRQSSSPARAPSALRMPLSRTRLTADCAISP